MIELNPKNAAGFNGRGVAMSYLNKYDAAIIDFTRAIQLEPKDAKVYLYRASAFHKSGEVKKAKADLEKARKLDPSIDKN